MKNNEFVSFKTVTSLFRQYEIPIPQAELVHSADEAVNAFQEMDSPVALKIISPVESHKSDRGLLKLGIETVEEVFSSSQSLLTKAQGIEIEGLLVQKMVPMGVEVIAGLVNDPAFGVMVVFGAGGILVELMDDVILRLAPIGKEEALWIIRQHPIDRLLQGYRGQPPVDIDSLACLLERLSVLGKTLQPELGSLDINPVIVSPQGVYAVDYRMRRKDFTNGAHN